MTLSYVRERLDTSDPEQHPLLQVSTVCRLFANAAQQVLRLSGRLDLAYPHPSRIPKAFSSKLMLSWAPDVQHIVCSDGFFYLPGVPTFLAAALRLSQLTLSCHSVRAAGEADAMLVYCGGLKTLTLQGDPLPCMVPLTVQTLHVRFRIDSENDAGHADLNHAFLCRLLRLPHLRVLGINLFNRAILSSSVQLGKLDKLMVHFELSTNVDLAWLRVQPVQELELVICLDSSGQQVHEQQEAHARLISELQPLQLTRVKLSLCSPLPQDIAARWTAVQATEVELQIHTPPCNITVLPSICSERSFITVFQAFDTAIFGPFWTVPWASLVCGPGRKVLELPDRAENCPGLHVVGCDGQCPDYMLQPWELTVITTAGRSRPNVAPIPILMSRVRGLPPSQSSLGYRLWNQAAMEAGWDKLPVVKSSGTAWW